MNEWQRGWRIILGCALGSGTGVVLLFFTFSLFILPVIDEFGGTRGDLSNIQALVIAGALGSPLMGWAVDRLGFRRVYFFAAISVILIELAIGTFVTSLAGLAIGVFMLGLIGVGTTAVTVTRPVNAWFDKHRGLALGFAACGTALATVVVPPPLELIIATYGWRAGFLTLAGFTAFVGLPAVYFLVHNEPPEQDAASQARSKTNDWSFLRHTEFWLMAAAMMAMGAAGAGFISQMSPMVQAEGLNTHVAALALSAFAVGQLSGRLIGGWCLDRFDPRNIAILLNLVPALGFVLLLGTDGALIAVLAAAYLIGFQQGAELDIFAYFIARRYGILNYGTVYGALIGLGWIGNAAGIIGVGQLHDVYGSYGMAQLAGALALVLGALLIAGVRLPARRITEF
jgi:predicted MFS family arabinose efflux permease